MLDYFMVFVQFKAILEGTGNNATSGRRYQKRADGRS